LHRLAHKPDQDNKGSIFSYLLVIPKPDPGQASGSAQG